MAEPVIPFGKYKGCPVSALPRDYLFWLATDCDLNPLLRAQVGAALDGEPIPTTPPPWTPYRDSWREIGGRWVRLRPPDGDPDPG